MFSFKRSLITIVSILVISVAVATLIPFAISGQDKPLKRDSRRSYYLTQTTHTGSQALSACGEGYHMASLWEIFDTSNLRYDTALGFTRDDSGFGPPIAVGFVRTGRDGPSGENCNAWTSDSGSEHGTGVSLAPGPWNGDALVVSPWQAGLAACVFPIRVWCVQD